MRWHLVVGRLVVSSCSNTQRVFLLRAFQEGFMHNDVTSAFTRGRLRLHVVQVRDTLLSSSSECMLYKLEILFDVALVKTKCVVDIE